MWLSHSRRLITNAAPVNRWKSLAHTLYDSRKVFSVRCLCTHSQVHHIGIFYDMKTTTSAAYKYYMRALGKFPLISVDTHTYYTPHAYTLNFAKRHTLQPCSASQNRTCWFRLYIYKSSSFQHRNHSISVKVGRQQSVAT